MKVVIFRRITTQKTKNTTELTLKTTPIFADGKIANKCQFLRKVL